MIELTDRRVSLVIGIGCAATMAAIAVAGGVVFLRGDRGWPAKEPELVRQMAALDTKMKIEDRTVSLEAPMAVDAAELRRAYNADDVRADSIYRGKRLLVNGIVKSVQKEESYDVVVVLRGAAMFEVVRATLIESESAKAANLVRGGPVVLLCTGNGRVLQTPSVTACTIQ